MLKDSSGPWLECRVEESMVVFTVCNKKDQALPALTPQSVARLYIKGNRGASNNSTLSTGMGIAMCVARD